MARIPLLLLTLEKVQVLRSEDVAFLKLRGHVEHAIRGGAAEVERGGLGVVAQVDGGGTISGDDPSFNDGIDGGSSIRQIASVRRRGLKDDEVAIGGVGKVAVVHGALPVGKHHQHVRAQRAVRRGLGPGAACILRILRESNRVRPGRPLEPVTVIPG